MSRRANLAQITRFAGVGLGVAAFYVVLFATLRRQGLDEVPANATAFCAAIVVQYVGQTTLTFRQPLAETGQILRFGVTVSLGYAFSALVTGLIGPSLGWTDWISAAVVAVLLPAQNYTIFRLWVYTRAIT